MNNRKVFTVLILIAVSVIFTILFYNQIVFKPNNYLFSDSGDAIKNYFTYATQIKGDSYINSGAMNYPYGENLLYLDCQPVFTLVLKLLSKPFPSITNYSIAVINILMVFSFVISIIFLFFILVEFKVGYLFSAIGAFSIAVLSPQIFRMTGHLALSYSFFIPLTWYLFIRFFKSRNKLKWSVLLFINNLCWYFVHAYLGMIMVSFIFLCYVFEFLLYDRKKYSRFNQWGYIFLQTVLPLVMFWTFIIIFDKHTGRPDGAFGFLVYTATFSSVFLPHHKPLRPLFEQFLHIENQSWEGWAYIGIGSSVIIILFLINLGLKFRHRKNFINDQPLLRNKPLVIALASAFVLLLLAMGFPFRLKMQFLLNWFPVISNFRGIGRFSWVFYYVITVSGLYYVHMVFEQGRKKLPILLLVLLLPVSYVYEGISYHKDLGRTVISSPNIFDKDQLPESMEEGLAYMNKNQFQAIIPLPFYHIGSEIYGKPATDKMYRLSMILSYHSRIPLMSNFTSRTSIPESKKIMQILSPDFYSREINADIKTNKPFLIIYSHDSLSEAEYNILKKGEKIFSCTDYSLYSLSKNMLFRNTAARLIRDFEAVRSRLVSHDEGFLVTKAAPDAVVLYDSFEDVPAEKGFRGNGAYSDKISDFYKFRQLEPSAFIPDTEYVLSFWMFNEGKNYGQHSIISKVFIEEMDTAGNIAWLGVTHPSNSLYINGSWTLVELNFSISGSPEKLSVYFTSDEYSKKHIIIDDLLIRRKDSDVYKITEERDGQVTGLFKNNHQIKLNN